MQEKTTTQRYPLFDVFRLLLAVAVVWFHYSGSVRQLVPAVPLFLALSGFLVLQSFENSTGWFHFAKKRALRILPAFAAMLLLVGVLFGPSKAAGVLVNYATLGLGHTSVNSPVWSLGWEELYYGLLAVMFAVGAYRKPWLIGALGFGGWLAGLVWYYAVSRETSMLSMGLGLSVAFFMGNYCYLLRDKIARLHPAVGLAVLSVGLTLCALQLPGNLPVTAAGMLMTAVAWKPRLPKFPDLSYGVYIYHMPLLLALGAGWSFVAALPIVCIASWYLVEAPALRLKNRKATPSPKARGEALPAVEAA
jgi:peptidoglycan/LPS O-acetylase OafA/YrhL